MLNAKCVSGNQLGYTEPTLVFFFSLFSLFDLIFLKALVFLGTAVLLGILLFKPNKQMKISYPKRSIPHPVENQAGLCL